MPFRLPATNLLTELQRLAAEDQKLIVRRFFEGESAAEISVEDILSVTMTMGASGLVDTLTLAEKSQLPEAVVECIVAATKRWKFPTTLAGKTFERQFVLPVPGK